jgi:hypothetical protein
VAVTVTASSAVGYGRVIAGLGPYPPAGGVIDFLSEDLFHEFWLRLGWPEYEALSGEARVAVGDLDGDGQSEIVVGLGRGEAGPPPIPNGMFLILDSQYNHLAWGQVNWPEYNAANGETWPACGDLDGDGRDEILIGLGAGGGGRVEVFQYAAGAVTHREWLLLDWDDYNTASGEVRPAAGDVDGDGEREVVLGLGPVSGNAALPGGAFVVTRDALPLAWGAIDWAEYNSANGESWPACADLDGDGRAEILLGMGKRGGGRVAVMDYAYGYPTHLAWITLSATDYNRLAGETHPAAGDLDGDGRDEVLVGPGKGGGGWLEAFDDAAAGMPSLFQVPVQWESYGLAHGGLWPAVAPARTGPTVFDVAASPNPTLGQTLVVLSATAGLPGGSPIAEVEWWVDPREGPGAAMAPLDGALGGSVESVGTQVDVSGWPNGSYTLQVRARDHTGAWGSAASVALRVGDAADTVTVTQVKYKKRVLTVRAKSNATPGSVTLWADGLGNLLYKKKSRSHSRKFKNVLVKPPWVTVRSSNGGVATAPLP